jgi:hypothetical protein
MQPALHTRIHTVQAPPALLTSRHTDTRATCITPSHATPNTNMNSAQLEITQTGPPIPSLQALPAQHSCIRRIWLCTLGVPLLRSGCSSTQAAPALLAGLAASTAASQLASSSRDANLGNTTQQQQQPSPLHCARAPSEGSLWSEACSCVQYNYANCALNPSPAAGDTGPQQVVLPGCLQAPLVLPLHMLVAALGGRAALLVVQAALGTNGTTWQAGGSLHEGQQTVLIPVHRNPGAAAASIDCGGDEARAREAAPHTLLTDSPCSLRHRWLVLPGHRTCGALVVAGAASMQTHSARHI